MMVADKAILQPEYVLRPAARRRSGRRRPLGGMVLIAVGAFLVLVLCLAYVAQRSHLTTLTYRLEAANQRIAEALRDQEFLRLEAVRAQSLQRIEQVATAELGMARPVSRQYVVLESGVPAEPVAVASRPETDGFLSIAVDWVTRHWPRVGTAEAGGSTR